MVIEKDIPVPYGDAGARHVRRRLPPRGRRARGAAGELVAVRQAQPGPDRPDLPEQRGPAGVDLGPDHVRGAGPGVLGPARLRHRPRRRARHLVLRGAGHLPLAGGGACLRRPGGVGRHPAVERGEGRAVRGLLPVEPAVVRRRPEPAAPGCDQPVGGVERHLSGGRPARRHPGDLLLALHLGAMGRQHHRDRGPGVRDGRAPLVRRVLGEQGRGPRGDPGAGVRGGQLGGPGAAQPRHAGGLPPHRVGTEMARRPRPQEVGLLLRTGEHRAPARLLRPLPAREGHRPRVLAARARGGAGAVQRGHLADGPGMAARGRRVPAAPPGRRQWLA